MSHVQPQIVLQKPIFMGDGELDTPLTPRSALEVELFRG